MFRLFISQFSCFLQFLFIKQLIGYLLMLGFIYFMYFKALWPGSTMDHRSTHKPIAMTHVLLGVSAHKGVLIYVFSL